VREVEVLKDEATQKAIRMVELTAQLKRTTEQLEREKEKAEQQKKAHAKKLLKKGKGVRDEASRAAELEELNDELQRRMDVLDAQLDKVRTERDGFEDELRRSKITFESQLQELEANCAELTKALAGDEEARRWSLDRQAAAAKVREECVVCLVNQRDHILIPCGHFVLCGECAFGDMGLRENGSDKTPCPICKAKINKVQQVYSS